MGDNQQTSTSTSNPSNPNVNETLNRLLGGINSAWDAGPSTFNENLYSSPADGGFTRRGWQSAVDAASNPRFSSGVNKAYDYSSNLIGNGGLTGGVSSLMDGGGSSGPGVTGYNPGTHSPGGFSPDSVYGGPHVAGGAGAPFSPDSVYGGPHVAGSPGGMGGSPMGGQQGDLARTRSIGDQYGQLANQGGLDSGQQSDLANTRSVGDQFGALSGTYRNPGIYESTLMGTARGDNLNGNDPLFQRDLSRTEDAAGAAVNSAIGSGGRFGSNLHVDTLGRTIGGIDDAARLTERNNALDRQQQALAGISGERQQGVGNQLNALTSQLGASGQAFGMGQQGVNNRFNALGGAAGQASNAFGMEQQGVNNALNAGQSLSGLYSSSLLPSQTMGAVGGAQDADAQAQLLGRNDLSRRQNDARTNLLAQLSSIFGGNASAGGTTQTQTQPGTPWWQSVLGGGIGLAGAFL